jgi:RIO kinase 1
MEAKTSLDYYDALDDDGQFDESGKGFRNPRPVRPKKASAAVQQFIKKQDDSSQAVDFTYKPARFEEGWLLDSLGYFFEQKWISDVLVKVKGGKEASVYLCRSGGQVDVPFLAAKVFRPRMLRNLKNDRMYLVGRNVLDEDGNQILDLGMLKAHHKRSVYGEQIRHQSWIMHEFQTLLRLHDAGADVPKPYETSHNAILMDYIGSEETAAPTLNTVNLSAHEAVPIFKRLVQNIEIMLKLGVVHGDLSAYNVLYWEGQITLIDFPQVVFPQKHPAAFQIFQRDITRLCAYFESQGLHNDPASLAAGLWKSAGYRLRHEVHPAEMNAEDPQAGDLWRENQKPD